MSENLFGDNAIAKEISRLTDEIHEARISHLATKCDLKAMEDRLTSLISLSNEDRRKLSEILRVSDANKEKLQNIQ